MYFKNKFFIFSILVILPTSYFLITCSKKSHASINLNTTDYKVIVNGKKIYANNYALCFGIYLEGQKNCMSRLPKRLMPARPDDEKGHKRHYQDRYLFMVEKYEIDKFIGKKYPNNMPPFKDMLSDKEIIAVQYYIRSSWPVKIKEINNNINSRLKR